MNPLIRIKTTPPLLITLTLLCIGLLPKAEAVVPPPDGGYPNFNTAEGQNALFSLTTGVANTGVGWFSLWSNTDASFNTAVGAGTLLFNVGDGAGGGTQNTAVGVAALLSNTGGFSNTAVGTAALLNNTDGNSNTATGVSALNSNTTGANNTAVGSGALQRSTGNGNTALGAGAGAGVAIANNVICIGAQGANVDNRCFIGNIFGAASVLGVGVFINELGQLGTIVSSRRFKEEVKPMEQASEALFELKPVTFRYKKGIDPQGIAQFGLVAEDVEKVNPDLVVSDKEGKPYSVRYDAVNAMLLNEFLKEHKTVQKLKATVMQQQENFQSKLAEQQKQIEALTAGLQKVCAQLEASKPAPQVVSNNQ